MELFVGLIVLVGIGYLVYIANASKKETTPAEAAPEATPVVETAPVVETTPVETQAAAPAKKVGTAAANRAKAADKAVKKPAAKKTAAKKTAKPKAK